MVIQPRLSTQPSDRAAGRRPCRAGLTLEVVDAPSGTCGHASGPPGNESVIPDRRVASRLAVKAVHARGEMTNATLEQSAPPIVRRSRRWRRVALWSSAVVVVLALVVTAAIAGWRYRHPTVFAPAMSGLDVGGRVAVGTPAYVGMTYPHAGSRQAVSVHLDGASPRIETNSAEATVTFLVCTLAPNAGVGAIGSALGSSIHTYCSHLVPVSNAHMTVRPALSDQIVMRIVAHAPGVVQVDGLDLHYSAGWQHGWQWVGETSRFTVPSVTSH
jgi:hypothetical protein